MNKLEIALNLMTATQRKVWVMRLEGKTPAQIAKILGCKVRNIQAILKRGKNRAKKIVRF